MKAITKEEIEQAVKNLGSVTPNDMTILVTSFIEETGAGPQDKANALVAISYVLGFRDGRKQ